MRCRSGTTLIVSSDDHMPAMLGLVYTTRPTVSEREISVVPSASFRYVRASDSALILLSSDSQLRSASSMSALPRNGTPCVVSVTKVRRIRGPL